MPRVISDVDVPVSKFKSSTAARAFVKAEGFKSGKSVREVKKGGVEYYDFPQLSNKAELKTHRVDQYEVPVGPDMLITIRRKVKKGETRVAPKAPPKPTPKPAPAKPTPPPKTKQMKLQAGRMRYLEETKASREMIKNINAANRFAAPKARGRPKKS